MNRHRAIKKCPGLWRHLHGGRRKQTCKYTFRILILLCFFFLCFRSLIHLLLISSFGIVYTFTSSSQVLKLSNFTIRPPICFLFSVSEISVLQFLKYHVLKPSRIIFIYTFIKRLASLQDIGNLVCLFLLLFSYIGRGIIAA